MYLLTFMPRKVGLHLIVKAILLQLHFKKSYIIQNSFAIYLLIFNYIINYAQLYFYSILLFNILFCYPIGIFTVQKIPEVVHNVEHKGFCELTSFW